MFGVSGAQKPRRIIGIRVAEGSLSISDHFLIIFMGNLASLHESNRMLQSYIQSCLVFTRVDYL